MNGFTDEQIKKLFADVTNWLHDHILKCEHQVINTFINEDLDTTGKIIPVVYLAKSIEKLAEADIAVFTPGWEKARGCRIEHQIAEEYGISIFEIKQKLSLTSFD